MAIFSRRSSSTTRQQPPRPARQPAGSPPSGPWRDDNITQLGERFLDLARKHRTGIFSKQFWSDKLMDWAMKDHEFKVQLFRFVDAFPVLRHDPDAVHEHLIDYLTQPGVTPPPGMGAGLKLGSFAKGAVTGQVSGQIEGMGRKFIAGTDAESAHPKLEKLWKEGIAFSVDLLGEACIADAEADDYREKYLDLVGNLPDRVASWQPNERLESDHLGWIPRTNVSIKISSLSARSDPIDTEGAIRDVMSRVEPILELARDRKVFINFDMEQFELKDLTIELFKRCCERLDFRAGIAMQAYLKSGDDDIRNVCEWAKNRKRIVSVRLVKGAYWDFETIHAEEQGWPCPVWNTKRETDACFERMAETILSATPRTDTEGGVKLALGSHNVRSIAAALDGLQRRELPNNAIEIQMLHGMADQLKHAATEMGLRVREYVPVGEMIPGMAYLVRRLLENTSNESWLRAGFLEEADTGKLLASPHVDSSDTASADSNRPHDAVGTVAGQGRPASSKPDLCEVAPERHRLSRAPEGVGDGQPFFNEPQRDFAHKQTRDAFAAAVKRAEVPTVANDRTPEQASGMIDEALDAFPKWRDLDPRRRARALTRAAAAMRERRDELSGVIIKENGKCWRDADGDVCEAIDFCEYYARESVHLFERTRLGRFIGELDEHWHQPRGVCAVISPWNFPIAIACGMTTAALVTGNPVILKPAEQTPGIAKIMHDILIDAIAASDVTGSRDLARKVLHFCPAPGETTGASIVRDPRIALIAFTGSKAVGLDIVKAAGITTEEQQHVKKVVCEMGGKNAIIIDTSADLDEAVVGVRQSAFGFQGQKCSACSRVIVVDPDGPNGRASRTFIDRFVNSTRSLVIGDPTHGGTDVGPIIDEAAAGMINGFIESAHDEGLTCELAMEVPEGLAESVGKPYVGPHIFSGVTPEHTIAQREIFGPVAAVMHASDFDEALRIANGHPYKLTGGVYTRKPAHIERAKREFRVGNLYINRGCTGALVARQPFGGFGMSGVGSKAGGAEYLYQFVEPRASCENTMRRGFAPEL